MATKSDDAPIVALALCSNPGPIYAADLSFGIPAGTTKGAARLELTAAHKAELLACKAFKAGALPVEILAASA